MSDVPPEETPTTPPDMDTSPASANATPPPAGSEPNYYDILGVPPTADAATIEAAYSSRSLRFRIGQLRERARAVSGPTQAEVERAFAVLGNPEARARYDAAYFPEHVPPPTRPRRRIPIQVWIVAAIWLAVLAGVIYAGFQLRAKPAESAITTLVNATATGAPSPAGATSAAIAIASPVATATTVPATSAPPVTPTTPPPTATATPPPPTPSPPAGPTVNPGQAIFRPTETPVGQSAPPTATPLATAPPTAPAPAPTTAPPPPAPTATPVPPPPPTPTPEPPPPPPQTPAFVATDWIGTALPVNFRTGPGVNYASQGGLPRGTLLAATGRSAYAGGYLWREFALANGRRGWVRDIDVLPVR